MLNKEKVLQLTVPTPYAVGDAHLYLIKGDALTLVDAGVKTDEAWTLLKQHLKSYGYEPKDIEQIILTHHHPDHTGLIDRFDHVDHLYGHKLVQPWLKRDEQFLKDYIHFYEKLYKEFAVPEEFFTFSNTLKATLKFGGTGELSGYLKEGDVLPGHPAWKVMETPGHAQSHLSFYNEENHSLIAGDHLLAHISPNPLLEPPIDQSKARPKPLLQLRESMIKLLEIPIDQVYPGHGPLFNQVDNLIPERLKKQESRAEKVYKLIVEQPLTVFQICQKLFPKQYKAQFGLTMSETVGQLDYLESINKVRKELENDYYVIYPNNEG